MNDTPYFGDEAEEAVKTTFCRPGTIDEMVEEQKAQGKDSEIKIHSPGPRLGQIVLEHDDFNPNCWCHPKVETRGLFERAIIHREIRA